MATIKVVLDTRIKKADDTYHVKIRITHQRKTWYYPTKIYLKPDYWDSKNSQVKNRHPNAKLLNLKIKKRLHEVQEKVLQLEIQQTDFSIEDIKALFIVKQEEVLIPNTIKEYAQTLIEQQRKSGRVGNAQSYQNGLTQTLRRCGINAVSLWLKSTKMCHTQFY